MAGLLLIADDAALLIEMSDLLRQRGYDVACASNAQALDAMLVDTPSTIILDASGPRDGVRRVMRRLRGMSKRARILIAADRGVAPPLAWALRADGYIA